MGKIDENKKKKKFVQSGNRFWRILKCKLRPVEQFMRLMGDELIADIILVLKIQIESALCHSGLLRTISLK